MNVKRIYPVLARSRANIGVPANIGWFRHPIGGHSLSIGVHDERPVTSGEAP